MTKKKLRGLKDLKSLLHDPNPFVRAGYIAGGIGLVFIGLILLWIAFAPAPDFESFLNRKVALSTKIYDRTGEIVLYDLNTDVRRTTLPLTEVSPYIQKAAIAIEDDKFYQHSGVRPIAVLRAALVNLQTGEFSQGGSTITQQVVKLTVLTGEKSIIRKVHEWFLAWKLERHYTKDQILEMYLNDAPFGGSLYGVEAAARAFFGTSAKEVTLAEAAYLAALPQAPTYYSPYGNNREALDARKNLVLERMRYLGHITEEQFEEARNETVAFNPQQNSSIIAPHFVFYIRQQLEEKYGADVVTQGLKVITTLDAELQHTAESIVYQYALENERRFNASNAALVAIDPKTGQILSMVGSRSYFDPNIEGNYNVALALRQPGSAFKPFVYATALAKGYTPQTIVFDLPTQFSTACAPSDNFNREFPCYAPGNYDDKFRGPMTFTTALAQSINVPAVKTMYLAGIDNVLNLAARAGITTLGNLSREEKSLALALGAGEVRLLDLTNAFATFGNNGVYNKATGILRVEDVKGKVLEEYTPDPQDAVDPGVAHDLSWMLSNNEARQPEYPPNNPFYFPGFDVAAKTGTTNEYRDVWTVGYTPTVAIGVWAGNNDNSAMVREIAGYVVAPMWNAVMQEALQKYPREYFHEPRPIPESAPPALRGVHTGPSGTHDILHWVDKDNPLGGGNSIGDGQYAYWEYPIGGWSSPSPFNPFMGSTTPFMDGELIQEIIPPEILRTLPGYEQGFPPPQEESNESREQ
ncbi:MAG TPA: PBP1A family penicillin-binding protein [Candidatus Paceibacterota bacterium]|nr:PBP1A family penicillin-binding protein [Candidatus Paceibacterota bacterium]